MTPENVLSVYDARYALDYDARYIKNPEMLPATLYQAALLERHLRKVERWLDVACGTGFYLSMFPNVRSRAGLDLSPAMLKIARQRVPGAKFLRGSFLKGRAEWKNSWQFVSCMWWAYCLVQGIHEIERLVSNIASWLTKDGTAFVPLCNPRNFHPGHFRFPARDAARPGVTLTGILWSWSEDDERVHRHMTSPLPETMCDLFRVHFRDVEIVRAPLRSVRPGYWSTDFLVARGKRRAR